MDSPENRESFVLKANGLLQRGQYADAVAAYEEASRLSPRDDMLLNEWAAALHGAGRHQEALQRYAQSLECNPHNALAHHNQGLAWRALGDNQKALECYERALKIRPVYADALSNRGNALRDLRRPHEALASYDRAVQIEPGHSKAHMNRGLVLVDLNRHEEALSSYDRALQVRGDYLGAYENRGVALIDTHRYEEALATWEKALRINPDYADIHFAEGLCRLLLGQFERGWQKYEWRWDCKEMPPRRAFEAPLWLGQAGQELAGKTILLYAEQGLGDTVQFCRYVPMVAQRGARVILEVQRPLRKLLGKLEGVDTLVCAGDPLPAVDHRCPLLSLPLALGTRLDTIPAQQRYIGSDPALVQRWRTRLGDASAPRVGLVWRGNPSHRNDRNRSIELEQLTRVLSCGVQFVSLQKQPGEADRELLNQFPGILHLGDELADFTDTAAVIESLDLVISVDTSVAHLAAALGKPVWLLLPHTPDWRWLLERRDSPWYPTMRLFRQPHTGDWDGVVDQLAYELRSLIGSPPSSPPSAQAIANAFKLFEEGKNAQAQQACERVLEQAPGDFNALHLMGAIRGSQGEYEKALARFDAALRIKPGSYEALLNRGVALQGLQRLPKALESVEAALRIRPEGTAIVAKAKILRRLGRHQEAAAAYEKACAVFPADDALRNDWGVALKELGAHQEAMIRFGQALELNRDNARAHFNQGVVWGSLGDSQKALECYERALCIRPDYVDASLNSGNALVNLGRHEEALRRWGEVPSAASGNANVQFAEGLCRLLMGQFEPGWEKYEWRWDRDEAPAKRQFDSPMWLNRNGQDLAGKTILLHAEQGFGDTVQFCRYAALVAKQGARVILEVQPLLRRLLAHVEGVDCILSAGEPLPPFDYHCPLMSLPLAFGTRLETIPANQRYLGSEPELVQRWRARLGDASGKRVGLVWRGSQAHKNDRNRSIGLAQLAGLADCGARFISLQKEPDPDELVMLNATPRIMHLGAELADFADTAAVIESLDLVISVDTSVAHVAAALGKPVWLLLPFSPDWRWLLNRQDSPWYPTMRLFRQQRSGDWTGVADRVAHELRLFVEPARATAPVKRSRANFAKRRKAAVGPARE